MGKWISVKEQLPPSNKAVLGYCPQCRRIYVSHYVADYSEDKGCWFVLIDEWHDDDRIMFWMPLPPLPEGCILDLDDITPLFTEGQ